MTELEKRQRSMELQDTAMDDYLYAFRVAYDAVKEQADYLAAEAINAAYNQDDYLNAVEAARATTAAYREAGYLDPVETTHAAVMAFFFGKEKQNE